MSSTLKMCIVLHSVCIKQMSSCEPLGFRTMQIYLKSIVHCIFQLVLICVTCSLQGLPNLQGLAGAGGGGPGAQPTPQDHEKVSNLLDPWGGRGAGFA